MTDRNKNNHRNNKDNSCLHVCPRCAGTGKVSGKRDDTDICGFVSEKVICPLCRGSGKFKRRQHFPRAPSCRQPKRMPLRKLRPGRGGRPSLGKNILLQPNMPTTDYPEGDMIPKPQQEQTGSTQQPSQFDIHENDVDIAERQDVSKEAMRSQVSDEVKITNAIGGSFAPNLHIDDRRDAEASGPGRHDITIPPELILTDPTIEPAGLNTSGDAGLLNTSNLPEVDAGLGKENIPSPMIGMQVPEELQRPDPFDITGIPDPANFKIDTDIGGNPNQQV